MTVRLQNTSRDPFVASLYHAYYCEHACACSTRVVLRPGQTPAGDTGLVETRSLDPMSFRLEPGCSVEMPDSVLKVPQVKTALGARPPILRTTEIKAVKPAPVVVPETLPEPESDSPGSDRSRNQTGASRQRRRS